MYSLLSFPPDANYPSSWKLHLSPHTSYLCPSNFRWKFSDALTSLTNIDLSLLPVAISDPYQDDEPTLFWCPYILLTTFYDYTSHICISPFLLPTQRWFPFYDQDTEVTWLSSPRSQSSETVDVQAFQMYTLCPSDTANMLLDDQSTRLR